MNNWYFIKVEFISKCSSRKEECTLIINCHPSEIRTKVDEYIVGDDIKIVDVVKL